MSSGPQQQQQQQQQRVGPLVHSASMTGKAAFQDSALEVAVEVEAEAVESYLSPEQEAVPLKALDASGFSFAESGWLRGHANKVVCCHFSQDGGLLASGGHDKRAHIWGMNLQLKASLEEHSHYVTDVRFSATSQRLATSSFDKTIKIWDAENVSPVLVQFCIRGAVPPVTRALTFLPPSAPQPYTTLRTLSGHSTAVTSVDFHPLNEDIVASCDGDSEIKMWSVNQGSCTQMFKVPHPEGDPGGGLDSKPVPSPFRPPGCHHADSVPPRARAVPGHGCRQPGDHLRRGVVHAHPRAADAHQARAEPVLGRGGRVCGLRVGRQREGLVGGGGEGGGVRARPHLER